MRSRRWFRFWETAWRSYRWVWSAARREFIVTLAAEVVAAVAVAVVLLCARSLATDLTESTPDSLRQLGPVMACLAGALFVSGISMVVQREARLVVTEQVLRHLQTEIIDIACSVDYERFEEQGFHDLLDRATTHGPQRAMQMAYDLVGIANSIVMSSALLFVLASSIPEVLPALLLLAIPFVVAARLSARLAFRLVHELTAEDRLRSSLFWTLADSGTAKEVRVFDLRHHLSSRWSALFASRIERVTAVARRRIVFNGMASLAASALVAVLLVVIVGAAIDDQVSLADAAIAIVALQQLSVRIRGTANAAGSLSESALFLDDFNEFRSQREADDDDAAEVQPLAPFGSLRVESVSFRYPGTERLVLADIDLDIGSGQIVALVGLNGSGKSTLAHLVANLYRPTTGRITWDGVDIASIPRRAYWRSLGIIYQDYVEYPLTARENIAISDRERMHDLAAIEAAARRAGVHEAIMRLPHGYEAMLSREYEGGSDLSQGEWQRTAVARAFFRDAPLLILDEPASALDPLAERELYTSLAELAADRSVLLISHRFSTVRLADQICVLHDGRIVERGGHDELMALNGHYANMFRAQAAGFVEAP